MTPEQLLIDNPVDFMQRHIVIAPGNIDAAIGDRYWFKLERSRSNFGTYGNSCKPVKVYNLVPSRKDGSIRAYWCPFKLAATCEITVGYMADLMFTVKMDGCSFGIGAPASDGSRRVAHINMFGQNNSRAKQNNVLRGMGLDDGLVDPTVYMNARHDIATNATTFGVRNVRTREWRFFYQLSEFMTANQLRLVGVMPVA